LLLLLYLLNLYTVCTKCKLIITVETTVQKLFKNNFEILAVLGTKKTS